MSDETCIAFIRRTATRLLGRDRGERGAGAVEFALIVPILFLITVAIIEMSNIYFTRSELSEITRDATRRFALGAIEKDEIKLYVQKRLKESTELTGDVDVDENQIGDITDVTLSLSVPFSDVLIFNHLVESLWSSAPDKLSVNATMMKQ